MFLLAAFLKLKLPCLILIALCQEYYGEVLMMILFVVLGVSPSGHTISSHLMQVVSEAKAHCQCLAALPSL